MKLAAEIAQEEMGEESARLSEFRDRFIAEVPTLVPKSHLNGNPTKRLPNNAHFRFEAIEREIYFIILQSEGNCSVNGIGLLFKNS